MIRCDYCGLPAVRRIHADYIAEESWFALVDRQDFNEVADRYKQLSTSRYACSEHFPAAYGHVAQAVGPSVHIVLDAEL
jgi:hypothetical protein